MGRMISTTSVVDSQAVRLTLLDLASSEDEIANTEAALVPYWSPVPASVLGHRAAATAIRAAADRLCR